jgi:uncharacterized membrane protein YeiH
MMALFLDFLDMIGSLAFALSGALAGKKKQMDGFGIIFLASITTFGGGLTRDMLLATQPVAIFDTPRYLIIATLAGLLVRYVDYQKVEKQSFWIAMFDACGLAVFSAFGSMRALDVGAPFHGIVLMGMITGCVGGIMRDLLRAEVPMVFYGDFYARASLLGSLLLYVLYRLGFSSATMIISCVTLVLSIRMYVILKNPLYRPYLTRFTEATVHRQE